MGLGCRVSGGGTGMNSSSATAANGLFSEASAGLSCLFPGGCTSRGLWTGKAGLLPMSGFHCGELGLCSSAPCGVGTKHKPAFQGPLPHSPPFSPNLA